MRFLHLSDLHIGKRVNEFSMIEDQKFILKQILKLLDEERTDGVLLAGDIYDKPIPSVEAVQLFELFLNELVQRNLPVFIISGNHDSPERLSFGSRLMEGRGVYISRAYDGNVQKVTMEDMYGEVCIYLLPFIKPTLVRHVYGEEEIAGYQQALELVCSRIPVEKEKRNILLAHQFVTGASRCESEEIMVGGVDQVDVSLFDAFDYVALGHLHSPQQVGRSTVRYCGTPLKYSFSEAEQQKSVTMVELEEKGSITVRTIPLKPLRDMRKIRGTYMEVTAKAFYEQFSTQDYVHITLTDEEDILDGLQKLRIIYPNLMHLEYDNSRTRESRSIGKEVAVKEKSEFEIFQDFYQIQNNQPMSVQQAAFIQKLILKLKDKEADNGKERA